MLNRRSYLPPLLSQTESSSGAAVIQGYFTHKGRRIQNMANQVAPIFQGAVGFGAFITTFTALANSEENEGDLLAHLESYIAERAVYDPTYGESREPQIAALAELLDSETVDQAPPELATTEEEGKESKTESTESGSGGVATNPSKELYSVSASSAHHDLKLIKSKAPSAAKKTYGFSFVSRVDEAADIALINAYIVQHNAALKGGPEVQVKSVKHVDPATHPRAKSGMIDYQVNGRIYSTHAESTQLFPVSGAGIVSGLGVEDMLARLHHRKELNFDVWLKFYSETPVKQLSKAALTAYKAQWEKTPYGAPQKKTSGRGDKKK